MVNCSRADLSEMEDLSGYMHMVKHAAEHTKTTWTALLCIHLPQ